MLFKLGFGTGSGVTRGQIIYKALGVSFFFSRRSLRPPCTEWARSSIAGRPYEDPWGGWGARSLTLSCLPGAADSSSAETCLVWRRDTDSKETFLNS